MPIDSKLYDILNLDPNSSDKEIKSAYLKKYRFLTSRKNKIDHSEKIQQLTEIKNILLDRKLRNHYDFEGLDSVISFIASKREFKRSMESQILRERANLSYKNVCLSHNLPLKDLYLGNEQTVMYSVRDFCPDCSSKTDFKPIRCQLCLGNGINQSKCCPRCNGSGQLSCHTCNDVMFLKKKHIKTFQVFNIEDGESIIGEGLGNEIVGGRSNLIIFIDLEPHPKFYKYNNDIIMEMELNWFEAMFGFSKVFQHIDDVYYKLTCRNEIINHNDIGIIKDLGFELDQDGLRGNLIILFNVVLPATHPDPLVMPYMVPSISRYTSVKKSHQSPAMVQIYTSY
ncbi:hypothetical protein MXB_5374 [Myxobolus squamalis]|nr:hypothetical protein MXB_5374 [Myxobolus squamalis]